VPDNPSDKWEYPESVYQSGVGATPASTPPASTQPPGPTPRSAPQPEGPRSRVADHLLLLFGRLAAALLGGVVLLTGLLAIFRPTADLAAIYTLLNTQLSLIIGAVLGYAAHPEARDR
jgi:predicted lipid-binding transport protein (Tim44 family)